MVAASAARVIGHALASNDTDLDGVLVLLDQGDVVLQAAEELGDADLVVDIADSCAQDNAAKEVLKKHGHTDTGWALH